MLNYVVRLTLRGRLNGDRVKRRGKTVIVTTRDVFGEISA